MSLGRVWRLPLLLWLVLTIVGCNEETRPQMDWESKGVDGAFFSFPWPNDMRRQGDSKPDFTGFPGSFNPLLRFIISQGERYIDGFGTNSGVVFQFNNPLFEPYSWYMPGASLEDAASIMLVNIDPGSINYLSRIPVESRFEPIRTLYQPGHLLTVKPYPGYALQPKTRYAAILYTGILDNELKPIKPALSVESLVSNSKPNNVSDQDWQSLLDQWQEVSSYVSIHTDWRTQDIAAFSVFTTMDPTAAGLAVARSIEAIEDEAIIDSVNFTSLVSSCGEIGSARVQLPSWQEGDAPYVKGGGMIVIDQSSQLAIQQGVKEVSLGLYIGCAANDKPKIPMVYAAGTGGNYRSGRAFAELIFGESFDQIMLSVTPLHSSDRAAPELGSFADELKRYDIYLDPVLLEGVAFYNILNPAANIGNHIQSAAEQIYLRRIGILLPEILRRAQEKNSAFAQLDFSGLSIDGTQAALFGQSQGASIVPLALAMDSEFDTGYVNGASSHAYFAAVHRVPVRKIIQVALAGILESEVNYFHPLMQVLQTFHEQADSVNFIPHIKAKHLLQTAGTMDGCVPKEASRALGFAFMRSGLMQGQSEPDRHNLLNAQPYTLPMAAGNLSNGSTGLYYEASIGHSYSPLRDLIREFLMVATGDDSELLIYPPHYISRDFYDCEGRREQGWDPIYQ